MVHAAGAGSTVFGGLILPQDLELNAAIDGAVFAAVVGDKWFADTESLRGEPFGLDSLLF